MRLTHRKWTRHITGREEGAFAFLTANHMLGFLEKLKDDQSLKPEKTLIGIVEVGGASMQIVFPVDRFEIRHPFVRTTKINTQYLSDAYPNIKVLSTSFMQLGISSAIALLLKGFCQKQENLENGICRMPCFNKNYEQACTTQNVKNIVNQKVVLDEEENRLLGVANFCDGTADELKYKPTNKRDCIDAGVNPEEELETRMSIHGCNKIEGTGDFSKCLMAVKGHLLDSVTPLPANIEAQYVGFDSPLQIFHFLHPQTDMYVTGKALVEPVQKLQQWGLLSKEFKGNLNDLNRASEIFCKLPVIKTGKKLAFKLPNGNTAPLNEYNGDFCMKLAYASLLVQGITKQDGESDKPKGALPNNVIFEDIIYDPKTHEKIGEFGWAVGALLSTVLRSNWPRLAYNLGAEYFRDLGPVARQ